MGKVSRERIALAIFMACILLIGGGIAAYLVAGHSWNYAASRIDDATGEMEGYRVIVYEGVSIPVRSRVDSQGMLSQTPVSSKSVVADYQEKGATVLRLHAQYPSRYDSPTIVEKDGYRVGIVNIAADEQPVPVQQKVDYLTAHGVNTVIALVPSSDAVSNIQGVDVILDLGERSALATGSASTEGYRIAMPAVGTVGAIVISPSEVVSARTIAG